jgi:hypothetical protein
MEMNTIIIKTLRRLGLGSLTGVTLYLFIAVTALALTGTYTSLFTLGGVDIADWGWFTIGNSPAWFMLGIPANWEAIAPTYTVARIVLALAIGLIIAAWEVVYILGSEEINWTLVFTVAILGTLAIVLSQVIWSVL